MWSHIAKSLSLPLCPVCLSIIVLLTAYNSRTRADFDFYFYCQFSLWCDVFQQLFHLNPVNVIRFSVTNNQLTITTIYKNTACIQATTTRRSWLVKWVACTNVMLVFFSPSTRTRNQYKFYAHRFLQMASIFDCIVLFSSKLYISCPVSLQSTRCWFRLIGFWGGRFFPSLVSRFYDYHRPFEVHFNASNYKSIFCLHVLNKRELMVNNFTRAWTHIFFHFKLCFFLFMLLLTNKWLCNAR